MRQFCLCGLLALATLLAACGSSQSQPSAATVNGHAISMATYDRQVLYKRQTTKQSTYGIDVCSVKTWAGLCRKLKQTVLNDLVNEEVVRQWAAAHGISISRADFNRQWTIIFQGKFRGNRAVLSAYLKAYGITLNDLEGLIETDMLDNQVMYRLTKRMPPYAPATRLGVIVTQSQSELGRIQAALGAGTQFNRIAAQLAARKGSYCSQNRCGDLGWIPNTLIPPEQRAAVTAHPGSIVGPITGQNGSTFVFVEAHAPRYVLDTRQELNLRRQYFARWVEQLQRHARVHSYVSV